MRASIKQNFPRLQPAGRPPTAMQAAFLRALTRLAARWSDRSTKNKITLPTGTVDIGEVEIVLCALGLINPRTSR